MEEERRISLVGGVVIYCNPDTYPSQHFLDCLPEHISVGIGFHPKHAKNNPTVIIGNIGTDRSEQTVQTQSRLLLKEQSDQCLLCLLFCLHLLNPMLHYKIQLFHL